MNFPAREKTGLTAGMSFFQAVIMIGSVCLRTYNRERSLVQHFHSQANLSLHAKRRNNRSVKLWWHSLQFALFTFSRSRSAIFVQFFTNVWDLFETNILLISQVSCLGNKNNNYLRSPLQDYFTDKFSRF